jgi:hypothetical protein
MSTRKGNAGVGEEKSLPPCMFEQCLFGRFFRSLSRNTACSREKFSSPISRRGSQLFVEMTITYLFKSLNLIRLDIY